MKITELLVISEIAPIAGAVARTVGTAAAKGAVDVLDKSQTPKKPISPKLKSTLNALQSVVSAAGGGKLDTEKTAQTLTRPLDPTKPDPTSARTLQPLIPALSQALQDPQAADQIQTAIKSGVKNAIAQQAKAQADQAKKQQQAIKV